MILYADKMTGSIERAMDETNRRRKRQLAFNKKHNITPTSIVKEIKSGIEEEIRRRDDAQNVARNVVRDDETKFANRELIAELEKEMYEAAENLQFEKAAMIRDKIIELGGKALLTQ